jgi:cathepsin L
MEGRYEIKSSNLIKFSEQQLVDCSHEGGNAGCNGGLMDSAFTHAETHALDTEASYPYTGKDGTCHENAGNGVNTTGFTDVTPNSPEAL